MEKKLAELYNELVTIVVSMIPEGWEKIYYLGEVESNKLSWSSVFYFVDEKAKEVIKSHEIPERYNVSEEIYNKLLEETNEILIKIYDCFIENGQEPWEQLSLSVNNEGDFNIDYLYGKMKDSDLGQMEREIIWAFETFGYKPKEGSYTRKILEKYISKK